MKGQFLIPSLAIFLSSVSLVNGAVAAWGQCGGITYSGETICVSGYSCVKVNDCKFSFTFMGMFVDINGDIRLLPVSTWWTSPDFCQILDTGHHTIRDKNYEPSSNGDGSYYSYWNWRVDSWCYGSDLPSLPPKHWYVFTNNSIHKEVASQLNTIPNRWRSRHGC